MELGAIVGLAVGALALVVVVTVLGIAVLVKVRVCVCVRRNGCPCVRLAKSELESGHGPESPIVASSSSSVRASVSPPPWRPWTSRPTTVFESHVPHYAHPQPQTPTQFYFVQETRPRPTSSRCGPSYAAVAAQPRPLHKPVPVQIVTPQLAIPALKSNTSHTRPRPISQSESPSYASNSQAQAAYEIRKRETELRVRAEQEAVLEELAMDDILPGLLQQGKYGLIIAADSTPKQAGGYCVDIEGKACQFYTLPLTDLPWTINPALDLRAGEPDEFEMKNLLFALLVWLPEIRRFTKVTPKGKGKAARRRRRRVMANGNSAPTRHSHVLVCTDNFACRKQGHMYGQRVVDFLNHLRQCEGVLIDSRVFDTTPARLRNHATFLKPADDLSRNCTGAAKRFLTQLYGLDGNNCVGVTPVQLDMEKVYHRLTEECGTCGFQIEVSPSLKSFRLD